MNQNNGWMDILTFTLVVVCSLFVAQFIALMCLLPLYNFNVDGVMLAINHPLTSPGIKMQMLFMQGLTSFIAFIVAPLGFIKWKEEKVVSFLYRELDPNPILILLAVSVMVVSMPITSLLVEWNASLKLPPGFESIEMWAREKEDFLKELTEMLTKLDNPLELIVGLFVIALIPAIGEELVFRGYLQNKISRITKSPHLAIWMAAFLFSAIHFQFYGFLPRMMLGAMFGYLYFISGQFHLPVVAHFTNNGLTLFLIYLKNKGRINFDIESEESIPVYVGLISICLTVGLFMLIKSQLKEERLELQ